MVSHMERLPMKALNKHLKTGAREIVLWGAKVGSD